jgi:hypothetical protein
MRSQRQSGFLATLAVGILFIATGAYSYVYMGRFLDHARETQAVVIEMRAESATPKGRTHPVVRFTTENGRVVVAESKAHHRARTADILDIVYDVRNPQSIEITTLDQANRRRLVIAGLAAAVGLIVCAIAVRQALR